MGTDLLFEVIEIAWNYIVRMFAHFMKTLCDMLKTTKLYSCKKLKYK